MRFAAVSLISLFVASAVMAQLAPGAVIPSGEAFPIVADFDGDGLDDLVQGRNVVLNAGGSFDEVRDLALPADEKVVGALDVNGDRVLDLLTVTRTVHAPPDGSSNATGQEPVYRMYIGDASRHYATGIHISTGPRPYVADVDGDAKDDLVILAQVRPDGRIAVATEATVLRSRGDGTFERLAPFRIPTDPQILPDHRILSGDLNHDRIPDFVIRCTNDLVVLRGLGGGKFAVERRYIPVNSKFGAWSTVLGDVDGDSHPDVVTVGLRSIRVLFGDGRGNFPRSTTAAVAKVRDIAGLPGGLAEVLNVENMNQPRNLAAGHFTREDRVQIAAGTVEGDIVVFSYEQGALREVSRTATELWAPDLRTGSFRADAGTDLYAIGTLIWGVQPPRLFHGAPEAAASLAERAPARRRATRSSTATTSLRVEISGSCVAAATERWTFRREGIFGVAQHGQTTVEAVFDGPEIYYRLSAPYAAAPVQGVLTQTGGSYSGTAELQTSCGWSTITVTAQVD